MPVAELPAFIQRHADGLAPIQLEQLQVTAELTTRVDRKFIVPASTAGLMIEALGPDHRILEIDGRRSFVYHSAYFDSPSLGAFRAHIQGRRQRYKCRTRHYVDSDQMVFELKLKGRRGETIKHQLPRPVGEYGQLTGAARAFVDERLEQAYGHRLGDVSATVETRYRRVTLAAADGTARVTFDFDVRFGEDIDDGPRLREDFVIVETKSERGQSRADRLLKQLGERPANCSKYCVGVSLLQPDVGAHHLLWLLRRYFSPMPSPAPVRSLAHG